MHWTAIGDTLVIDTCKINKSIGSLLKEIDRSDALNNNDEAWK